jgi:3-hydroxyacyl-CoA dehydrogenase
MDIGTIAIVGTGFIGTGLASIGAAVALSDRRVKVLRVDLEAMTKRERRCRRTLDQMFWWRDWAERNMANMTLKPGRTMTIPPMVTQIEADDDEDGA